MPTSSEYTLPFRFRLARWVMDHRMLISTLFVLVTLGFLAGFPRVEIRTVFKDLLPKDDPFVQVYYDHPNFGNPLTVYIVIKCKHGTIYNHPTLQKVWDLTRAIDLTPALDHDQLLSVSTEKLRYVEANPAGVEVRALMVDRVPSTPQEIEEFRQRVQRSPNARIFYVSRDETATLIQASFQDYVDYGEQFEFVRRLVDQARDADHEIFVAGQPTLIGWVYRFQKQTYSIFAITFGLLTLLLIFYMRNIAGVVMPIVCAVVAGIWGVGFIGWLNRPIEPLLTIVPLLLVARTFSHCIQYTERYYEILVQVGDRRKAAEATMGVMLAPSVLGILTDVFGIIFIAITPIVTLHNHALFCGAWALWIIPTGVFLAAILLSVLPLPKNFERISGGDDKESGVHLVQKNLLKRIARLTYGSKARITTAVMLVIAAWAGWETSQIKIGNPAEGSSLLWHDSDFNRSVRAINSLFPGMNTLELVLESKDHENQSNRIALSPDAFATRMQLQALMESDPVLPPRATLSFSDYMSEGNRLWSGGNPQWLPVDLNRKATFTAGMSVLYGSSLMNFSNVMDFMAQDSTVSLWYADNKQETVDHALASARRAVDTVHADHPEFRIRMASGFIALQQAMNNVVHRYHWLVFGLVNVAIALVSAIAYRSMAAALLLLVPVNLSNALQMAMMKLLGIGLDINATIVAVMGVGIGIDYGIYLLSRIREEFAVHDSDWGASITAALTTTGKAIMFTASIMLLGIAPWYFLSDLKFMADMGLLLVAIMLINMALSLVLLPLLVWLTKPGFMRRAELPVKDHREQSGIKANVAVDRA